MCGAIELIFHRNGLVESWWPHIKNFFDISYGFNNVRNWAGNQSFELSIGSSQVRDPPGMKLFLCFLCVACHYIS